MEITLRWALGAVLALVFLFVAVGNAWTAMRFLIERKHSSAVPLIGGLCGVAACYLLPVPVVREWWWLPLLLDYGSVPVFTVSAILGVVALFREWAP